MVKVLSPLLSFEARGTIAGNLTFSQRKSGSQVRWQRKQKDVITPARTAQRALFLEARDCWDQLDFGVQEFGWTVCGGRNIHISVFPISKRAPQFACFVRDFLN